MLYPYHGKDDRWSFNEKFCEDVDDHFYPSSTFLLGLSRVASSYSMLLPSVIVGSVLSFLLLPHDL